MEWSSFLSSPSQPEAPRGLMRTSGSRSFWNILWATPDPGTQDEVGASFLCHHPGFRTDGPGLFLSGQPLGEGSGRGEETEGWAGPQCNRAPGPPGLAGWLASWWPASGLALLG